MLVSDITPLDEETLAHFGTKGMRWGVRKDESTSDRKAGGKETSAKASNPYAMTDEDRKILKAAGAKPSDSENMKAKYGPGSLSKEPPKPPGKLSQEQKDAIKTLLVVGGVAAASWYLYHKADQAIKNDYFNQINPVEGRLGGGGGGFRKEWLKYVDSSQGKVGGMTKDMVNKLSDEPVKLKAGTIFKRVSTEMETDIRPGGFYAAHKDEDVNRYKAMLPVFWKQWGKSGTSGYVVNLKANGDINAPSPKKTFDMAKNMLNDEIDTPYTGKRKFRDMFAGAFGKDDDEVARKLFPQITARWANENDPATKHFFGKLKGEGYNAVVDMNDAGSLSSRPMRVLDGKMFSVEGHERLSTEAIAKAQENIQAIVHAIQMLLSGYTLRGEAHLAHAGVKGMKWGVRKAKDVYTEQTAPQHKERNERIAKAAIAVGVVAVGAILLKRGGFKMSSPASKKIMLGGAKASLTIVKKSGRIMATASVKVGKVGGKTAGKITKLAGKGAYSGAIAGSKAAGRAVAQNGSKFYEKGIKKTALSTMRLASHASYRFTGRGKPIVNEVAKKSMNFNVADLLLNVRADNWGGRK